MNIVLGFGLVLLKDSFILLFKVIKPALILLLYSINFLGQIILFIHVFSQMFFILFSNLFNIIIGLTLQLLQILFGQEHIPVIYFLRCQKLIRCNSNLPFVNLLQLLYLFYSFLFVLLNLLLDCVLKFLLLQLYLLIFQLVCLNLGKEWFLSISLSLHKVSFKLFNCIVHVLFQSLHFIFIFSVFFKDFPEIFSIDFYQITVFGNFSLTIWVLTPFQNLDISTLLINKKDNISLMIPGTDNHLIIMKLTCLLAISRWLFWMRQMLRNRWVKFF